MGYGTCSAHNFILRKTEVSRLNHESRTKTRHKFNNRERCDRFTNTYKNMRCRSAIILALVLVLIVGPGSSSGQVLNDGKSVASDSDGDSQQHAKVPKNLTKTVYFTNWDPVEFQLKPRTPEEDSPTRKRLLNLMPHLRQFTRAPPVNETRNEIKTKKRKSNSSFIRTAVREIPEHYAMQTFRPLKMHPVVTTEKPATKVNPLQDVFPRNIAEQNSEVKPNKTRNFLSWVGDVKKSLAPVAVNSTVHSRESANTKRAQRAKKKMANPQLSQYLSEETFPSVRVKSLADENNFNFPGDFERSSKENDSVTEKVFHTITSKQTTTDYESANLKFITSLKPDPEIQSTSDHTLDEHPYTTEGAKILSKELATTEHAQSKSESTPNLETTQAQSENPKTETTTEILQTKSTIGQIFLLENKSEKTSPSYISSTEESTEKSTLQTSEQMISDTSKSTKVEELPSKKTTEFTAATQSTPKSTSESTVAGLSTTYNPTLELNTTSSRTSTNDVPLVGSSVEKEPIEHKGSGTLVAFIVLLSLGLVVLLVGFLYLCRISRKEDMEPENVHSNAARRFSDA